MLISKQLDNSALQKDVIGWGTYNWGRAVSFWSQNTSLKAPVSALEIGATKGGISLWLGLNGVKVTCTDIRDTFPDKTGAMDLHRKYGIEGNITYQHKNILQLTDIEKYNLVVFKSVLGGIGYANDDGRQQAAIDNIHASLKTGGELWFCENMVASPLHQFGRKYCTSLDDKWNYPTKKKINKMLEKFSTVKIKTIGFLGAFGRTAKMETAFGKIDKNILERILPDSCMYIATIVAKK